MIRKSLQNENCSIARSLEVLGDAWTMLILREAFLGARRFADFESTLDISKSVLTQRLQHLVEHGVLMKVDAGTHGPRFEYALTPMGKDLIAVITALRQWGDRWIFGEGNEPLLVVDRRSGEPIAPLRFRSADGEPVRAADLELRPGPGSSAETLQRFARG